MFQCQLCQVQNIVATLFFKSYGFSYYCDTNSSSSPFIIQLDRLYFLLQSHCLLSKRHQVSQSCADVQNLTLETVMNVFDLAEAYHALSLRDTCVLFILKQHEQMCGLTGYLILTSNFLPLVPYIHALVFLQHVELNLSFGLIVCSYGVSQISGSAAPHYS